MVGQPGRGRSSKRQFVLRDWSPPLDSFIGNALSPGFDGVDRKLVEHPKDFRGDAVCYLQDLSYRSH
jgi:hypothetical protein